MTSTTVRLPHQPPLGQPDLPTSIDVSERPRFTYDVALVGLGYVGLPTALAFHAAGKTVLGLDVSGARLLTIRSQQADLLPDDRRRLRVALADDRFALTDDPSKLQSARTVIIAVPTPVDSHLLPDIRILGSACASVVAHAVPGQVLILTSTTYVGSTTDMLVEPLVARGFRVGTDINVAFSPERIDPGNDRHSHEDVPRVVGGETPECARAAASSLHGYVNRVHCVSSTGAAEMTKLVENTFRAVNIALANELAEVSRSLSLDIAEVIEAAATKPYGYMPFFPGPGVGGHCIPCDPHYLLWQLRKSRTRAPVIEESMAAIAARPHRVIDRTRELLGAAGRSLTGARVLVLGVAYKPDVEDVRESPALDILAGLRRAGAIIAFHDPLIGTIRLHDGESLVSISEPGDWGPDLVVVHTLHQCLDLNWLESAPIVLDTSYRLRDLPRRFAL
ncbi:MAG: UDP-glucose 6-dehydrogenase [Frankiales bacterium]|nr:UDP-glucose 6-dehydrogenase [Frankiales bacterium]